MKERPIIFSDKMVNAILEGRKTQTRRVVKVETGQPRGVVPAYMEPYLFDGIQEEDDQGRQLWVGTHPEFPAEAGKWFSCAHGAVGDRLWVREAFRANPSPFSDNVIFAYRATSIKAEGVTWKPSIHMPRIASRLLLEITDVRVEQVQSIRDRDIRAEGIAWDCVYAGRCNSSRCPTLQRNPNHIGTRSDFHHLWNSINAKRNGGAYAWDANPWVWVIEFKRIEVEA